MDSEISKHITNTAVFRILVAAGAEINESVYVQALMYGDTENLLSMVKAGMDPNTTYRNGYTTMTRAAMFGNETLTRYLLSLGVKPLPMDLEWASLNGHAGIVAMLLYNGITATGTSLRRASSKGHATIMKYLLDSNPALISVAYTALVQAASDGYVEIVKLLLERGVDPNRPTRDGWTAFYAASFFGYSEILKLLEEYGVTE